MQKRRHLAPGHVAVGTELRVSFARVAPSGYASRTESVDVTHEDRIVIVNEQVAAAIVRVFEGTNQKRSHLPPSHRTVRVERSRRGSLRHATAVQPFDVCLKDRIVIVGEINSRSDLGQGRQGTMEERCHLTAGHRLGSTEPIIRRRITALCDARTGQPLDVKLEYRSVVIGETAARITEAMR